MTLTHTITIGDVRRELPIVRVADNVRIAFLKLYGDVELTVACARALAGRMPADVDVIVGPETGGILLAHELAEHSGRPYVIARKKLRPNMVKPLRVPVQSIGTPGQQELFLGEDDAALLEGRRVAVVDEVISSGGTLKALHELVAAAGGTVRQVLTVATEGERRPDVESLLHLPVHTD
ncbi:phosphoribosyltransferase family protein [Streptomyces decoyicus]|uniref:phosphoribosyltransferase family protein n=1 Tax=Streptomyces decoyicus TaxID=249567 RepID=UPI002E1949F5|nr:phosphoribosyltransferase family protein [Streptomyces decoyicus]WSV50393.1 phosphoribosyltransferase family protein [Streptomyces decoyicus]